MKNLKILIIGGSVGGLFAGIALLEKGFDVEIYERAIGNMESRGAGLGLQDDMFDYLVNRGIIDAGAYGVIAESRQSLGSSGQVVSSSYQNLPSTSWDYLWRQLKAYFPKERYHFGHELETLQQSKASVNVLFTNGKSVAGDLLLGVDGYNSSVRKYVVPGFYPQYAGYVVYRGLEFETELPEHSQLFFANKFNIYAYEQSHIVSYFVPGPNGELNEWNRRFNWVWYVNMDETKLQKTLKDRNGIQRQFAVPMGFLSEVNMEALKNKAKQDLPDIFAELVGLTRQPFVQVIADLAVPEMVNNRVAIMGDAAFIVRPHTASGTAKAFRDATLFADYLYENSVNWQRGLKLWEKKAIEMNKELFDYGLSLGRQNGLGFK